MQYHVSFDAFLSFIPLFFIFSLLLLTILMCWQESRKRKINFFVAMLICFATSPLLGYFIISGFPLKGSKGCQWCGNTDNEVEFCGVCGKNEAGLTRQHS